MSFIDTLRNEIKIAKEKAEELERLTLNSSYYKSAITQTINKKITEYSKSTSDPHTVIKRVLNEVPGDIEEIFENIKISKHRLAEKQIVLVELFKKFQKEVEAEKVEISPAEENTSNLVGSKADSGKITTKTERPRKPGTRPVDKLKKSGRKTASSKKETTK